VQVTLIVTSVIFLLPWCGWYRARSRATPTSSCFRRCCSRHSPDGQLRAGAELHPFGTYFRNSAIVSAATVVGTLVACVPAAYAFSILRWPGRDLVFRLVLATIMLPFPVVMVPQYLIFRNLAGSGRCSP